MNLAILEAITKRLQEFQTISSIKRISTTTLQIIFDASEAFFIDLGRGSCVMYKTPSAVTIQQDFKAPFDVILQKRFNNATIKNISLLNNDKILFIETLMRFSYKTAITILQIELTGKHMNAIILNEAGIILEALKHINSNGARPVRVGSKLGLLSKKEFSKKEFSYDGTIDSYLLENFSKKQALEFEVFKQQKLSILAKQKESINEKIKTLPSKQELLEKSLELYKKGNALIQHKHELNPQDHIIYCSAEDSQKFKLERDLTKTLSQEIDTIFHEAKKYKQKGQKCHIEKEQLDEKLYNTKSLYDAIMLCTTKEEIETLLPSKKNKTKQSDKKNEIGYSVFVRGIKIRIGRNEKENATILRSSKANDLWFHLKNHPSCHVVVENSKQKISFDVINIVAKICAQFSCKISGKYSIDYTQRRNIKIKTGANVLYSEYKTILVKI